MANTTVDTPVLRETAGKLDIIADEYDRLRGQLLSTANSTESFYRGDDNRVFIARVNEFCRQMMEVSNRVREAAQIMHAQSGDYDTTESENAHEANRLPGI